MPTIPLTPKSQAQLRWSCRRGMLELDLILTNFLDQSYNSLTPPDQLLFVALLNCPDQDLYLWLTGAKTPTNPQLAQIVEKIKACPQQQP